jgi:hypothetical protein
VADPTGASPRFSDDRQWWWTGTEWIPASQAPEPPSVPSTPTSTSAGASSPTPTPNVPQPSGNAPLYSEDRKWRWDGATWVPTEETPVHTPSISAPAVLPSEQPHRPASSTNKGGVPWWLAVPGLVVCVPAGLILTWLTRWSTRTKLIASATSVLIWGGLTYAVVTAPPSTPSATVAAVTSPRPTPSPVIASPSVGPSQSTAPSPSAKPSPSAAPSPTNDPHAVTVANLKQSILDNTPCCAQGDFANVKIVISAGGKVRVTFENNVSSSSMNAIVIGMRDAAIVFKAIDTGWYPAVTFVVVDETDTYQDSQPHPAAILAYGADPAHAKQADLDAVIATKEAGPYSFYCNLNEFYINGVDYIALSDDGDTQQCLANPASPANWVG